MIRYQIRVVDEAGDLVVGATLRSHDDTEAEARFMTLPLPAGRAELWRGERLLAVREPDRLADAG